MFFFEDVIYHLANEFDWHKLVGQDRFEIFQFFVVHLKQTIIWKEYYSSAFQKSATMNIFTSCVSWKIFVRTLSLARGSISRRNDSDAIGDNNSKRPSEEIRFGQTCDIGIRTAKTNILENHKQQQQQNIKYNYVLQDHMEHCL